MRSVLVAGASNELGRRVVEQLAARADVERVAGIETAHSTDWVDGVELLSLGHDHREIVELLHDNEVDTVIDCGLAPGPSGLSVRAADRRVIDVMRMGAAVGHKGGPVRAWVIASSSLVYPVDSNAPLLRNESDPLDPSPRSVAAALLEAEAYARDIAVRAPHLDVAILRLQQLCSAEVRGPLAALLSQPLLPAPIGYDPPLQLLALSDAVRALVYAAELELAGIYNVASSGVLRFSEARAALGRRSLPVLPLEAGPFEPLARALGLPHIPHGMLDWLRFGQALDTAKLESAGWKPELDQRACLATLRG